MNTKHTPESWINKAGDLWEDCPLSRARARSLARRALAALGGGK